MYNGKEIRRILTNLWLRGCDVFVSPAFVALFSVWTKCSAIPFEAGWYGAYYMCFTPLSLQNVAYSP